MQAAIKSLTCVASRLDNADLNDAARSAWQAAGFDDTEWAASCENGQAMDEPSVPQAVIPMPSDHLTVDQQPWTQALALIGTPPSSTSGRDLTPVPLGPEHELATQPQDPAAYGQQLGYRTGRMSPRLDYGLWPERPVLSLTNPPIDILPYLGANTSLSSLIFWNGLSWGFRLIRAALDGDSKAAVTAHKVFGEIVPMKPDRRTLNVIHARLTFRKLGYLASDHPGYDPEGGVRIQTMMARICETNGTPLENFLRPDGIEDFLRGRLGEGYRVIELALQGLGSSEDLLRVRRLVDMIVRSSVCLGDGPRLGFERMIKILEFWLSNSRVS